MMRQTRLKSTVLSLSCAVLGACTTMDATRCTTTDWRALGHQSALEAKPDSYIDRYVKACNRHQVAIDVSQFNQGYSEGAKEFCTPKYVYLHVRKVGQPEHVELCPKESIQSLEAAYELAMEYFLARDVLSDTQYQHSQLSEEEYALSQKINSEPSLSGVTDPETKQKLEAFSEAHKDRLERERREVSSKKRVMASKMDRAEDLIQLLEKRHFILLGIE